MCLYLELLVQLRANTFCVCTLAVDFCSGYAHKLSVLIHAQQSLCVQDFFQREAARITLSSRHVRRLCNKCLEPLLYSQGTSPAHAAIFKYAQPAEVER